MDFLIDTNVILDFILERKSYTIVRDCIMALARSHSGIYISATCVTDIFYILRRHFHSYESAYRAIDDVFAIANVLSVSDREISFARSLRWKDFEDCVQYAAAKSHRMDYIVTNNANDFEACSPDAITPDELLNIMNQNSKK